MRNSIYITACSLLLLAGCTPKGTTVLSVTLTGKGGRYGEILYEAAERVTEARLASLIEDPEIDVSDIVQLKGNTLLIDLDDEKVFTELIKRLHQPLDAKLMYEAPVEEADIVLAEKYGYANSGFNEGMIELASIEKSTSEGVANVIIRLQETGSQLVRQLFAEHQGEDIGFFLRGRPIYKFLAEKKDSDLDFLKMKVPNRDLAEIFVDDINVGLYVEFKKK